MTFILEMYWKKLSRNMRELLARIAVQLCKTETAYAVSVLTFDDITLDMDAHTVMVGSGMVKLTKTEYAILRLACNGE